MRDQDKSNAELIGELNALRQQLADMATLETEHKCLVEALRASEERYRTLFECANDAIFVESLADEIVDVNPSGCALVGYTRAELIGMKVSDLQAPEIRASMDSVIQDELAAHTGRIFESVDIHRDGTRIPVEVSNARLDNSNLVFSILRDITGRKQAEDRLRASEARWQFALEGAGDGVWDWNLSDGTIFYSRQWKAMLGYAEEDIGRTINDWDSLVHPEDLEMVYAKINAHLAGQTPLYSSEHRLRCKDGQYKWVLDRGKVIQFCEDGTPVRMIGTHADVTQRRNIEDRLRDSEEQYRLLVENAPDAIFVQTGGRFAFLNAEALKLCGITSAGQLLGQSVEERFPPVFQERVRERMRLLNEKQLPVPMMEEVFLRLDGSEVEVEVSAVPIFYNGSHGALVFMRDITKRKQAEEQLLWTAAVNAAIAALYRPLTSPGTTTQEITGEVLNQALSLTRSKYGYVSEIDPVTGNCIAHTLSDMVAGRCAMRSAGHQINFNRGADGLFPGLWGDSLNNGEAVFTNCAAAHPAAKGTPEGHIPIQRFLSVPVKLGEELVGQIALANPDHDYTERDLKAIQRISGYYALAIQRLRKEQELRKANESLARAQQIAHLGSWEYNLSNKTENWSRELYNIMGFPPKTQPSFEEVLRRTHPEDQKLFHQAVSGAAQNGAPFRFDYRFIRPDGKLRYLHDDGAVVRDEQGNAVRVFGTTLDITDREKAMQERQTQVERLEALHEIDKAIAASQNLQITLDTLLRQVTRQLKVDAADILLYDPGAQTLDFTRGIGFQNHLAERISLPAGHGFAGQAILTRRRVLLNPLPENVQNKKHSLFALEGFTLYIGLPLISKGQVKGVLEIFHRSPLALEQDWLAYLEILAGQTAIAIDNLQMLENLQRANMDLSVAYDTTIEGWSRALDLRDKETEGHSRRVMELTVRMSQAMGIHSDQLTHAYHGALLHDIGKMGVPDEILHKPSSLTPEEWVKMRRHPTLAFELLSPIPYLRHALEIPYCHHEKWDGSGYPRGLRGVQIPISARIFAVVDVWDALLSDRPYRKAWPKEKVIAYIHEQAGQHFDPEVVEMFLDVIKEQEG